MPDAVTSSGAASLSALCLVLVVVTGIMHVDALRVPSNDTSGNWSSPSIRWLTASPLFPAGTASFGDPLYIEQQIPYVPTSRIVVFSSSLDFTIRNQTFLHVIDAVSGNLLKSIRVESAVGPYSGWCSQDPLTPSLCYCGTDSGVVAVDVVGGGSSVGVATRGFNASGTIGIVWTYTNASWTVFGAPLHPTAVLSGAGTVVIFSVFENGVNGSSLFILNAFANEETALIFEETGTIAFTLAWYVKATNAVAYGRYHVHPITNEEIVEVVSRQTQAPFAEVFARGGYTYAPPGLWNNPNLDVDTEGESIFVYTRKNDVYRNIEQLDSRTGALSWNLPTVGPVPDYDTFAFRDHFYRLVTDPASPSTTTLIQGYNCTTTTPIFTATFPSSDDNDILLIGPQGGGFIFGLNSNWVYFHSLPIPQPPSTRNNKLHQHKSLSSSLATTTVGRWAFQIEGPSTGVCSPEEDSLFLGSTTGIFYGLQVF